MSSRIPPLLEPYLSLPPESSLTLLTGVLGASTNWLVQRYLYSFLKGLRSSADGAVGVVLVSFMRDGTFWRDGAGRLGLDLDAAGKAGRFVFVDGLTGLFTGDSFAASTGKDRVLRSSALDDVRREIEAALADLTTGIKILIMDQPDALLAASGDEMTSLALQNTLLSIREHAHATILTLAADAPLLHAQTTPLEREHASLVLSQAHAAGAVLALRGLDTGAARDVGGVVRVTGSLAGGGRELLYRVGGDGGVRVFERGA